MILICTLSLHIYAQKSWYWEISKMEILSGNPNLLQVSLGLSAQSEHHGRLGNCNILGEMSNTLIGFEYSSKPEILSSSPSNYVMSLTEPREENHWQVNIAFDGSSGTGISINSNPTTIVTLGFHFTDPNQAASIKLVDLQQNYEDDNMTPVLVHTDTTLQTIHLSNVDVRQLPLIPKEFSLSQNFPNPFNQHTVIRYTLPKKSHILIQIYNVHGQYVRKLRDSDQEAGLYQLIWNGQSHQDSDVPSGLYFIRLQTNGFEAIRKVMVIR